YKGLFNFITVIIQTKINTSFIMSTTKPPIKRQVRFSPVSVTLLQAHAIQAPRLLTAYDLSYQILPGITRVLILSTVYLIFFSFDYIDLKPHENRIKTDWRNDGG
ncbi:MAG: hypothetical protein VB106_17340, partial [Clostridiaceae bacterium]|nr:hypothetical protein [Clostridiaceae bacterium]